MNHVKRSTLLQRTNQSVPENETLSKYRFSQADQR